MGNAYPVYELQEEAWLYKMKVKYTLASTIMSS